MREIILFLLGFGSATFVHRHLLGRALLLTHQLHILKRSTPKPRFTPLDRLLWVRLIRAIPGWEKLCLIVTPRTVKQWEVAFRRLGWRIWCAWRSRPGRPCIPVEVRKLIRTLARSNPLWGAERIAGELAKLGISLEPDTVRKYMPKFRRPPSPGWRTFLAQHIKTIASVDLFVVPTVTFRVFYVLVILDHGRRRVLHWNFTEHPTSAWRARQLTEAFPWEVSHRYLIRDRDGGYAEEFRQRVQSLGMEELLTAPRCPKMNAHVERLIGSVRRECLDHIILFHEAQLRQTLTAYFDYYNRSRTHLALEGDCPEPRSIQTPQVGSKIVAFPVLDGLHHRYERRAA